MNADVVSAVAAGVGAVAAVGTFIVAVVAARYAKRQVQGARAQLQEARNLRVEQAQPYVAAYMEASKASQELWDLVIYNYGATAALDVTVNATPTLQRSADSPDEAVSDLWLPAIIPFLAPGQSWRTWWDNGLTRRESGLPDRHDVTIRYRDSLGQEHSTAAVLDWSAVWGVGWIEVKTTHDAAKSLAEMAKTMSRWSEDIHGGLSVFHRDGHAKDERTRQQHAEWQRRRDEKRRDEPRRRGEGEGQSETTTDPDTSTDTSTDTTEA